MYSHLYSILVIMYCIQMKTEFLQQFLWNVDFFIIINLV